MQTKIRHHIMWCLIRIFTVCLQNVLLNLGKNEKYHSHPTPLKLEMCLWIRVGKFIWLKWVNEPFVLLYCMAYLKEESYLANFYDLPMGKNEITLK